MICTFYSYKGGVGRSMALANVADVLARHGLKVLMIDFDLEAPGLEQFFQINQRQVRRHLGLLDLLLSYKSSMSVAAVDDYEHPFRRLKESFILPVYFNLPSGGSLDLMPAGQRGDEDQLVRYALSLRTFDWQDFYFNWAGETFFEWLRRSLVPGLYDVVLIDSRTGVTEMGGICAYQLADAVLMFCASNRQNVHGTMNVLRDFFSPRVQARRANRPLHAIVVPARVEQRDELLLQDFQHRFEEAFRQYTPPQLAAAGVDFWDLLIPHDPPYAFEERVISDPMRSGERRQMAVAFQGLVEAIALLAEPESPLHDLVPKPAEAEPKPIPVIEPQYDVTRRFAKYDTFLLYNIADRETVQIVAQRLREEARLRMFLDHWNLVPGEPWQEAIEATIDGCSSCVVFVGPSGASPWQNEQMRAALDTQERNREGYRVIPVLLPGADPEAVPKLLTQRTWVDLRAGLEDEQAFRQLVTGVRGVTVGPSTIETVCPYRGLEPFEAVHADFFFGREAMVEELVAMVRDRDLVAVVGSSGCGKSSLVRAGLVAALRGGALPGSENWAVCIFRPSGDPLWALSATLIPLLEPEALPEDRLTAARELGDSLRDGLRSMASLTAALRDRLPELPHVVLIADQFEELYTECHDEALRQAFTRALLDAATEESISVVLTLRADFFGHILSDREMAEAVDAGLVNVLPMSVAELRAAIELPAAKTGRAFEEGLVERILVDVTGEPGNLPLLQFTLTELWASQRSGWLTHDAYEAIGTVEGAITRRMDSVYDDLVAQGHGETLQRILLRLTHYGEGAEGTRRRAMLDDLVTPHTSEQEVEAVVQALADARLLVTGQVETLETDRRAATAEISHEALIQNWGKLRRWLDDDRAFGLWRERVTAARRMWEATAKDEGALLRGTLLEEAEDWLAKRGNDLNKSEQDFIRTGLALRGHRRRQRIMAAAALALVLTILSVLAVLQWRQAEASRLEVTNAQVTLAAEAAARSTAQVNTLYARAAVTVHRATSVAALQTSEAESYRAELEASAVRSQQLASQSAAQLAEDYYDVALLLAIEAGLTADTIEALNAVYQAFIPRKCGVVTITGHEGGVYGARWSSDSSRILTASYDGTAQIWDADTGEELVQLVGHTGSVISAAWSPDGWRILTASYDGTARVWDAVTGAELVQLVGHAGRVISAAWSPDSSRILTASFDLTARVWNADTGQLLAVLRGHEDWVNYVAWSPDGLRILTASDDGTARTWDAESGEPLAVLTGHEGRVNHVAWSPDGRRILTASDDGTARVWDAGTGADLTVLSGHSGGVQHATWSPDGRRILTASDDSTARMWDADTGEVLAVLTGHERGVNHVACSPDGRRILTASDDGTARVWDAERGAELITFFGTAAEVSTARWSPDGNRILTSSRDGSVQLYLTQMEDVLQIACQCATRNMTLEEWYRFMGNEPYRATCLNRPVPEG